MSDAERCVTASCWSGRTYLRNKVSQMLMESGVVYNATKNKQVHRTQPARSRRSRRSYAPHASFEMFGDWQEHSLNLL